MGDANHAAGNFTTEAQRVSNRFIFSFELCVLCVSVVKMSLRPHLAHNDKASVSSLLVANSSARYCSAPVKIELVDQEKSPMTALFELGDQKWI